MFEAPIAPFEFPSRPEDVQAMEEFSEEYVEMQGPIHTLRGLRTATGQPNALAYNRDGQLCLPSVTRQVVRN